MRPAHLLASVNSDTYPRNVICLACEYTWKAVPGVIAGERAELARWIGVGLRFEAGEVVSEYHAEGTAPQQFWEGLHEHIQRRGATTIVCERAALACSLLQLWDFVEMGTIDLCGRDERNPHGSRHNRNGSPNMRVVLESPPIIVEGKTNGANAKFKILDITNFGPQPSAEGVSASYVCNRIAAFVREMVAALKRNELGSLKDTVGSQSYFSFKRSGKTNLMECHNNVRAINLESDSLYGGRCESFRLGRIKGAVYHLDVSSMYQFCARESVAPVALVGQNDNLGYGNQEQLGEGFGLIADVTLHTEEPAYPYRDTERGCTIYPVGVFRTALAGPELLDAIAHDRVLRWHRAAWYEMQPALRKHMSRLLALKERYTGNDDMQAWIKLLGNCLIGKFASKDRKWVDFNSDNPHGKWDIWYEHTEKDKWYRCRSISGYTQREIAAGWSYDAIPAVASWVCSAARVRLLNLIRCATWEDTLYCDTDALMVNQSGYSRLSESGWIRDGEPGYLRAKNVSEEVEIHGIKAYDEEGRSVRAGRPLSVARAGVGETRYWINRDTLGGSQERRQPQALRVAIPFREQHRYEHGLVLSDGKVVPWRINEGP